MAGSHCQSIDWISLTTERALMQLLVNWQVVTKYYGRESQRLLMRVDKVRVKLNLNSDPTNMAFYNHIVLLVLYWLVLYWLPRGSLMLISQWKNSFTGCIELIANCGSQCFFLLRKGSVCSKEGEMLGGATVAFGFSASWTIRAWQHRPYY